MARLNDLLDSDDELPELSTILRPQSDAISRISAKTPSPRKETLNSISKELLQERHAVAIKTVTKVSSDKPQSRKQRPLGHMKQAHVNSLFFPIPDTSTSTKGEEPQRREKADSVTNRASPRKPAKFTAEQNSLARVSAITNLLIHDDDSSSTDLSGFIVPDSASDREAVVSRSPKKKKKSRAPNEDSTVDPQKHGSRLPRRPPSIPRQATARSNVFSLEEKKGSRICLESPRSDKHSRSELVEAHSNPDDCLTS